LRLTNGTPIKKEWFYSLEGEKTNLNWFLFESAMEIYDHIRRTPGLADYRKQYNEQQIAQFCTYYARRVKSYMLTNRRAGDDSITYGEYVNDFYPQHSKEMNHALWIVACVAFAQIQSNCKHCPQDCLAEHMARNPYFEQIDK